jgi:SAM-dependent methyltransferase
MTKVADGSTHRLWYDKPVVWAAEQDPRVENECQFLHKIWKKYGIHQILDVGCGVGSHCGRFEELGYSVVGLDQNTKLVQYAKKRFPKVRFVTGNQTKLKFKNEFDAVYTLNTVIASAVTNEDLVKTLNSYCQALKKKGILLIDTFNPIAFIDKKKYCHRRKNKKNALGYYATRKYSVDENKQLSIDETTFYDSKTGKKVLSDKWIKRMTFPQEMRFFLEQTGFKVLAYYGDFDFKHTLLDSFRMIVIAQKK